MRRTLAVAIAVLLAAGRAVPGAPCGSRGEVRGARDDVVWGSTDGSQQGDLGRPVAICHQRLLPHFTNRSTARAPTWAGTAAAVTVAVPFVLLVLALVLLVLVLRGGVGGGRKGGGRARVRGGGGGGAWTAPPLPPHTTFCMPAPLHRPPPTINGYAAPAPSSPSWSGGARHFRPAGPGWRWRCGRRGRGCGSGCARLQAGGMRGRGQSGAAAGVVCRGRRGDGGWVGCRTACS